MHGQRNGRSGGRGGGDGAGTNARATQGSRVNTELGRSGLGWGNVMMANVDATEGAAITGASGHPALRRLPLSDENRLVGFTAIRIRQVIKEDRRHFSIDRVRVSFALPDLVDRDGEVKLTHVNIGHDVREGVDVDTSLACDEDVPLCIVGIVTIMAVGVRRVETKNERVDSERRADP